MLTVYWGLCKSPLYLSHVIQAKSHLLFSTQLSHQLLNILQCVLDVEQITTECKQA